VNDALVICTRNRPDDVRSCLRSVEAQHELPAAVLVIDASDGDDTRAVAEEFEWVRYLRAAPGLTRQRNAAIRALGSDVELVHFVDDDVVLDERYVGEIRRAFAEADVGGVGGMIANAPQPRPYLLRRIFLLDSRRPGALLRSGRNILGTGLHDTADVDWLSGCCMSFRAEVLRAHAFDESMTGYALGEDVDYSIRVGHEHRLVISPFALVQHLSSPLNRLSIVQWSAGEVVARYARVRRYPDRFDLGSFWWSVLGEFFLAVAASAIHVRRSPLLRARAVALGCWRIARRESEVFG